MRRCARPGETRSCNPVTYQATQADVDAGTIDNTASATAQPPTGTALTRNDTATVTVVAPTSLALAKTAASVVDANSTGRNDLGDTVEYTFKVTNTGTKTLSSVVLNDAKLGLTNVACGTGPLAPGATRTCDIGTRSVYTVTVADVNAGSVVNSATSSAKDPSGATVTSPASSATVTVAQAPALTLDKTAGTIMDIDGNGTDVGDTVTYRFTITNSGNVTISAPTLTDATAGLAGTACGANPLAPGESRICSAVSHTLTQAEVDAGTLDNSATASGKDPSGATVTSPPDTTSTDTSGQSRITLAKAAGTVNDANGNGRQDAGDTIAYTFTVTNAGTTTVHDVLVSDPKLGITNLACATTLAPGGVATCQATAPYVVTQADMNVGTVVNTASATALDPTNALISATARATVPLATTSALALDKVAGVPTDANNDGVPAAGDSITYTFTVTNTGTSTLTNVTVTDPSLNVTGAPCAATLQPGESASCPARTYVITQTDANAGTKDNSATSTGTNPSGATIVGTDTASTPIAARTSIALTKTAAPVQDTNANGLNAGDPMVYSFRVTNTGTVSIKTVTLTDNKLGLSNVTCGAGQLDPGTFVDCTAVSYTTTQADWDAGKVVNSATATGTPINGAAVTSIANVTTNLPVSTSATLNKVDGPVSDIDGNGVDVGDQIAYSFTVTNTGSVSLDPVTITDTKLALSGAACGTTPLAPGEVRRCPAKVYTLTQADIDSGTIDNSATATLTRPDGTTFASTDTTSKVLVRANSLDLVKTASAIQDGNGNGVTDAGDWVPYTFAVTNTGTTTLTNVSIADPTVFAGDLACAKTTLAPGERVVCATKAYVLTQADVDAGTHTNNASAAGTAPDGSLATDTASVTTPIDRTSTLFFDKTVVALGDTNSNDADDPGDTITYSFTVTNTGNTTMTNLRISDSKLGPTPVVCGTGDFLPGETRTCQVTTTNRYTITQADIDAGAVNNTATASATIIGGATRSVTDSTSTPMRQNVGLTLKKTGVWVDVNNDGVMNVGDRIDYTLVGKNTGNVTLTDVRKNDPAININNALCGNGILAPGEERTCYPSDYSTTGRLRYHDLTQADIDAGSYRNDATLTGTKPDGTKIVAPSTFIEPITRSSSFTFDKVAGSVIDVDGNGPDAGDTITYTFSVTNTGNTSLNPVTFTDTKLGINAQACGGTALLPKEVRACPAKTYTLTQADIDAGSVNNLATVVATDPTGQVLSQTDNTSTTTSGQTAMSVVKTAGAVTDLDGNGTDAGDTVSYTIVVTNIGTESLSAVTITDAKLGVTAEACGSGTLAPQQSVTCQTHVYTLTQADIDAGRVDNTASATASGPQPGSTVTAPSGLVSKPLTQTATVTVDKQAGALVDTDGNGPDAGDTVTYTFVVKNTGNVTLNPVGVTDARIGLSADCGTLLPGEVKTCSTTVYALTQADVNSGVIDNVATVSGQPPLGNPVTSTDTTSTAITSAPKLSMTKAAGTPNDVNGNGMIDAGDTVTYTFSVTNTGNVSLTNVNVSDAKVGLVGQACGSATVALNPGDTRTGCISKTYVLKQADIDARQVLNTATASGTPPSGADVNAPASATVTLAEKPLLELDKRAGTVVDANSSGVVDAGDTVLYTFVVTNTGNVTLGSVTYDDPVAGISNLACGSGPLAPGESRSCASRTVTLTQAMLDKGSLDNAATARATAPSGATTTGSDTTSTTLVAAPGITLTKRAGSIADSNGTGRTDAGDRVVYTFTVRNSGNVTLAPVTYDDPILGITGAACVASLAPGATATCPAKTYTLTQADLDANQVSNTASVTGTAPDGTKPANTSTQLLTVPEARSVALDKVAGTVVDVNNNGRRDVGDTITYTLSATNSGTVTLASVTVSDPRLGLSNVACGGTALAPGETRLCSTRTYALTQADVDAGTVDNLATAVGTDTQGDTTTPATDTTSTTLAQVPQVTLTKTAGTPNDVNGNGLVDAGDTVTYSFQVVNTGSVTMTNVVVSDAKLGLTTVACGSGPLAPGGTRACPDASYTITQADVDAGKVVNNAVASATPPNGIAVTSPSSVTITPNVVKTMSFVKTASTVNDTDGNGPDAGDSVVYTFTVRNTGSVTLDPITLSDPLLRFVNQPCGTTPLAPGDSRVCATPTYQLTQADVDKGSVVNTASTTARTPDGSTITQTSGVTVSTPGSASIALDKAASQIADSNTNQRVDVGDTITYTFQVTNTGTETLNLLTLSDAKLGLDATSCGTGTLAPGASRSCTSSAYRLTQADLNAGTVNNAATIHATDPHGGDVSSPDSTSTPVPEAPALVLTKTAGSIKDVNGNGVQDVGDTIDYTFSVRNSGTVSLSPVTYVDPLFSSTPVACGTTPLDPGGVRSCGTRTYALTLADLNANGVTNTATASGTSPAGTTVTSPSQTYTPISAVRTIAMDKTSGAIQDTSGDGVVGNAGDTITYRFVVTNTGNLTLHDVRYSDARLGIIDALCGTDVLDPGQTRECDPLTYTLTQSDLDTVVTRGDGSKGAAVINTAVASGLTPRDIKVTGSDTVENKLTERPLMSFDKVAGAVFDTDSSGGPSVGDTIRYTFSVTNTGNVTINNLTLTDTKLSLVNVACSAAPLAPGATVACQPVTYTLKQTDIDAGVVNNSATVAGTSALGTAMTAGDGTSTPIVQKPGVDLTKAIGSVADNGDGIVGAGDVVTYTFHVVNTGNVTLNPLTYTDARLGLTNVACGGALAPGEARDCTSKSYVRTQADVDAGTIVNTATATGTYGSGQTVTDSSTVTLNARATIVLDKVAGTLQDVDGNGPDAGDQVLYSFTVRNTGTVTLTSVSMNDAKLGLAGVPCSPMPLAPGATASCPDKLYTLTQADANAGAVNNTASAQGIANLNGARTPIVYDSTTTDVPRTPSIALDKVASVVSDTNASNRKDAGDRVTYSFVVTNTGNTSLTTVTLTDPTLGLTVACGTSALEPGQTRSCTPVTHVITQAEMDAGALDNLATITGTDPTGAKVTGTDGTSTLLEEGPALTLDKKASTIADTNGNGLQDVGDTITYTFTITNPGSVTMSGVALTDAKVGIDHVTCQTATLAPGATATCTRTYRLTLADLNANAVRNTATVAGSSPAGTVLTSTASTVSTITPVRAMTLTKTAGPVRDTGGDGIVGNAGDTIDYGFVVKNTGNLSLSSVTLTDARLGLSAVACDDANDSNATLDPGASRTCASHTYTLTQADVDQQVTRGDSTVGPAVLNTARATAVTPGGAAVNATSSTETKLAPTSSLVLDKSSGGVVDADGNGPDAGDTITFTFKVTNTGTYSLYPVTISDPKTGMVAASCGIEPLAPGATVTCPARTITLTQADIDSGTYNNTATATGTDPANKKVTSTDSTSNVVEGTVSIAMVKTGSTLVDTNRDGRVGAGDSMTYTFTVTNTGTTSVNNVTITDAKLKLTNAACGLATDVLAPGATRTCPVTTYLATQADADAGQIVNDATAAAIGLNGARTRVNAQSRFVRAITSAPSIALDKVGSTPTDTNGNGIAGDAGHAAQSTPVAVPALAPDRITYTFTVTNTGNVTLSTVQLTDAHVGTGPMTCAKTTLAPGQSATCTRDGQVEQADVDAQVLVNRATVAGTAPDGTVVDAADSVTTPLVAKAALTLVKSHDGATSANPTATRTVDVNNSGAVDAGDTLQYTFLVTNTGSASLTTVYFSDPRIGINNAICGTTALLPGEARYCTTPPYTITQNDISFGHIDNTATADAAVPPGVTAPDQVSSTDQAVIAGTPNASLAKTENWNDLDADGHVDPGETITYAFTITNTGNVPLTSLTITDPKLGMNGDACLLGTETPILMPARSQICSPRTYTITAQDILTAELDGTQVIPNDATAVVGSAFGPATSPNAHAETKAEAYSRLVLDKTVTVTDVNGNGQVDPGDIATYGFTMTNDGNLRVDNPAISDPMLSSEPIACLNGAETKALAPHEKRVCGMLRPDGTTGLTMPYVLTQADILAGTVTNTATTMGALPEGVTTVALTPVSDTADLATRPTATLTVDKSASDVLDVIRNGKQDPGDTIRYTFVVTNTGNVPLTDVSVTDAVAGYPADAPLACPDASDPTRALAPGQSRTCPVATKVLAESDFANGTVENVAEATATPPDGSGLDAPADTDSTSTALNGTPRVAIDKIAGPVVDANRNGQKDAGDRITFTFRVTNTGAVALDPIVVEDPYLGLSGTKALTCGQGPLQPSQSRSCSTTYTITLGDQAAGSIDNFATVKGVGQVAGGGDAVVRAEDQTSTAITKITSVARPGLPGGVVTGPGNPGLVGLPQLPPGYTWIGVPPGVHGGPIYVLGPDGKLVRVDPRTGMILAHTGADVWTTLLAGLGLLAAGLALVILAARRRRGQTA
ncbi:hypothetical protein GCM10025862_31420 [Arsenicicoccus piscis]|uniref:DUF7507 domain-containing protein n=1 Tax=Arsenicicoccus piscis TaxID=673954 RepID=A0ABQ6HS30_9MICO|nr:hypothetical protein GCM10025862_31420 [Arsenicicoccus piscis]